MSQITMNIPDELEKKLAREHQPIGDRLRLEAAFALCSRGALSTSLAAKLAGMSYTEFLESAALEKVELFPIDLSELEEEILHGYTMGRQRLPDHSPGINGAA